MTIFKLSWEEAMRMGYILAYGPVERRPVDVWLEKLGLIEPYDPFDEVSHNAVWATDFGAHAFYGENGEIIWPHDDPEA
jgi:hypothetical protein